MLLVIRYEVKSAPSLALVKLKKKKKNTFTESTVGNHLVQSEWTSIIAGYFSFFGEGVGVILLKKKFIVFALRSNSLVISFSTSELIRIFQS